MLIKNHSDHFWIFNLSQRIYDYKKFNNQVHDWCGWPDHHAPPLELLFLVVTAILNWLNADRRNVVVVHCLVYYYYLF